MALDVVDEENEALPDLTHQFIKYLNGTMHEMWMGDPHEPKPDQGMKALPATGSIAAITAHGEPDSIKVDDSIVIENPTTDDIDAVMQMPDVDAITVYSQATSRVFRAGVEPAETQVVDLAASTQVFDVPEADIPTTTINMDKRKPVQPRGKNPPRSPSPRVRKR